MNKTRQKLVNATEHLLRTRGLARVTTREIARQAGVAEGALYHHFNDKAELIHAVVHESIGGYREVLDSLPLQVGQRTVGENLEQMLQAAFDLQFRIVPLTCSLFADRLLLARIREIMSERHIGPRRSVEALSAYLRAEQRLGRVAAEVVPQAVAELLLASSLHTALLDHLLEREVSPAEARMRHRETVRTILSGLEPRISNEDSGS